MKKPGHYILKASATFDSAHFLKGYEGKCANLHGHRWKIEAAVEGDSLWRFGSTRGMLIDFGDLKKSVKELADSLDHALIYEADTLSAETIAAMQKEGFKLIPVPYRPTAENFARAFYEVLSGAYPLASVTVFETPDNSATYSEG